MPSKTMNLNHISSCASTTWCNQDYRTVAALKTTERFYSLSAEACASERSMGIAK